MDKRFIIVSAIFAIASFLLTPFLWPNTSGNMGPGPNLLPFFIIYSIFESITFGIGMAFLTIYWNRFSAHRLVFLSVVWMLVSWWPHDNFHRTLEHDNFMGLLSLEYGFHATLIISGIILMRFLLKTIKK